VWLAAQAPAKSIDLAQQEYETVAVTCQSEDGTYCGDLVAGPTNPAQVGTGEWARQAGLNTTFDPIRVTIAVGWRQQQRILGGTSAGAEFTYNAPRTTTSCTGFGKFRTCTTVSVPAQLVSGPDADGDGVIESEAMLSTLVTCR
jgi:hypothetical protein